MSSTSAALRPAVPTDRAAIEALVGEVVRECYGHLLTDGSVDSSAALELAWVAEIDGRVVAVMRTEGDWLDDLWIVNTARGLGIGSQLLALAERQIAARGHVEARLRVVAENAAALRFYVRHGWRERRRYGHERHGFPMVELVKSVGPARSDG